MTNHRRSKPFRAIDTIARGLRSAALPLVALAATFCSALPPAHSADWPSRPVTVVVPYAAGGNTDTMARIIAERLSQKLGQPFIVENVAGASGTIGTLRVARDAPDGYTLLFCSASQIIIAPLVQKVSYDPAKDFVPISIFGAGPYILGVKSSLPAATLQDFIAYAKNNPGKLNYASAGEGGIIHLTTALFLSKAGLDVVHVPYKSGAPALAALMTGEIEMYFGNASELLQQATNDRIKMLAVSSSERLQQRPDLPTVAEFYPGFRITSWNGFLAPAGIPQTIVDTIAQETRAAATDPEVAARLRKLGIEPSGANPAEFAQIIRDEEVLYRDAIKVAGVKPE
jgi:tripartite-type tricarboxylate transporter receptor subunit TctC